MLGKIKSSIPSTKIASIFLMLCFFIMVIQMLWNNTKAVPMKPVPMKAVPMKPVPVKAVPMKAVPVKAVPVKSVPMKAVPVKSVPVKSVPMKSVPVKAVPVKSVPVKSVPVKSVPVKAVPVKSVPVKSVPVKSVPVKAVPVKSVPVKSVHTLEKFSKLMDKFTVKEISCTKLFDNDVEEQEKTLHLTNYRGPTLPITRFSSIQCKTFVQERGYITTTLTKEEEDFPIAYSIIAYKDLGQVERLFRAIYRPQNAYCFHADKKSPKEFHEGLRRLVSCFPNAIMSSRSVDVEWGRWTNLECDLICMKDLLKRFPKWKYFINLTGQEFPLRTNLEIVRILKTLNGSNNIQALPAIGKSVGKPSFLFTWILTSLHITAVRGFVEFLFTNKKAIEITNILRDYRDPFPDQTLFGTVNHNPQLGAPGAYLGYARSKKQDKYITRLKIWKALPLPCKSRRYVRNICIPGIKDLPFINLQPELIINKLYWNFYPLTYDCLEERIFNNTWRDFLGMKPPMDLTFYKNIDSIKNHV